MTLIPSIAILELSFILFVSIFFSVTMWSLLLLTDHLKMFYSVSEYLEIIHILYYSLLYCSIKSHPVYIFWGLLHGLVYNPPLNVMLFVEVVCTNVGQSCSNSPCNQWFFYLHVLSIIGSEIFHYYLAPFKIFLFLLYNIPLSIGHNAFMCVYIHNFDEFLARSSFFSWNIHL